MEKKESNASVSERSIHISRSFEAPIELVWEAWTNPDHIKNWWGPEGFTNTIEAMDVRPGGAWELVMHGPDGTDYKNKSIYQKIVPQKQIVFEHISGPKFTATIDFTEDGSKTHINWKMLFESKEQLEQVVKTFKADKGLEQNIEKLINYLDAIQQNQSTY